MVSDAPPEVEELIESKVKFPLEGGMPIVTTAREELAPGITKQLIRRGRGPCRPAPKSKCFGASHF